MGIDDLRGVLFDGAAAHINHSPTFLPAELTSSIQFEDHLIRVRVVGRRRRPHRTEPRRANGKQRGRIDGQPEHAAGLQFEQFFLGIQTGNERHVSRLIAPLCQIHGKWCLGGAGNTRENDVGFVKGSEIRSIIMAHSKLDGFDTIEIVVGKPVQEPWLMSWLDMKSLGDAHDERA